MNFDRNTVIGFVILAALFFGYFFYTNQEQAAYRKEQAKIDSIANAKRPPQDTLAQKMDSARADTINRITNAGDFQNAAIGTEQLTEVNTDLFKIAFTNKGGQPKWIELNKFKNMDSGHVKLSDSEFDRISYTINTGRNSADKRIALTSDLFFQPARVVKNTDGSTTVSYQLQSSDSSGSSSIVHQYVIRAQDYMIDFDVQLQGADKLLTQGVMNLTWKYTASQQESDIEFEKQNTQIGFVEDGEFDYYTIGNRKSINFSKPVKWIGVRQRFFNTVLMAKNNF